MAKTFRDDGILIAGGYGVVGGRVAAILAPRFAGRVVIAGRHEEMAAALAAKIGNGARARRLDLSDRDSVEAALSGVGTVMVCVADHELHLLQAAIARGLAYTDIAPRLAFWKGAEEMNAEARRTGARVLLGAGLAPGISNMMARQLANELGGAERIETSLLLSLGDEFGPDSLRHVLESISQPFAVLENGQERRVEPFSEGRSVAFPEPVGPKMAYLFPWSDVVYYPKTLGARTAVGRFALEPPWVGRLASRLVELGIGGPLRRPAAQAALMRAVERLKPHRKGTDKFALVVTVEAKGRARRMALVGQHQADVTAAGAAELARSLAEKEVHLPGFWLPEQLVSPERFFAILFAGNSRPVREDADHIRPSSSPARRSLVTASSPRASAASPRPSSASG
jgi:saccharopine dehydrogenase-like NADP-dependent oxidoreductase